MIPRNIDQGGRPCPSQPISDRVRALVARPVSLVIWLQLQKPPSGWTSYKENSVCFAQQIHSRRLFALESSRRSKRLRSMWNDEDNNPYGTSFERRDSTASSTANPNSPGSREFLCLIIFEDSQDDEVYLLRRRPRR